MYRLVLELPFNIVLVYGKRYACQEEASRKAGELPGSFEIVSEDHLNLDGAIEVPFSKEKKRRKDC